MPVDPNQFLTGGALKVAVAASLPLARERASALSPGDQVGSYRVRPLLLPRGLRDRLYRTIARNRYRWFGRHETCMVPTPAQRERFLGW